MTASEEINRNVTLIDEEIAPTLSYQVPSGGSLHLSLASFTHLSDTKIEVVVEEGGLFEGAFADFSRSKYTFALNVHLKGKGARCDWHLASIGAQDDQKRYDTSVYHEEIFRNRRPECR